jgi:hypothetical protein
MFDIAFSGASPWNLSPRDILVIDVRGRYPGNLLGLNLVEVVWPPAPRGPGHRDRLEEVGLKIND